MSVEAPGAAIASATFTAAEGIASASIDTFSPPGMESGISFNPSLGGEISPIIVSFNPVKTALTAIDIDLKTMPHHVLDVGNLNPDRQVPIPELVFNDKLFRSLIPEIEVRKKAETSTRSNLTEGRDASGQKTDRKVAQSIPLPFVFADFGVQPDLASTTEPTVESSNATTQKPLEASGLSEGLMHMNEFADREAITDAIAVVENSQMPESQKTFWLEKFENLYEEKVKVTDTLLTSAIPQSTAESKVLDETESQVAIETQTETAGANPPNTPIEIATDDLNEAEPADFEEPEWDMFKVSPKKVVEQRSLKKRQRVAAEIVDESSSTAANAKASLKLQTEDRLYKLDVPDISETAGIVTGQLEYPPVALAAEYELAKVEDNDEQGILNALQNAVDSAPPITKKPESSYLGRKKQSELDPGARELADEGAQHIVLKRGQVWLPVNKPLRKEPLELDKANTRSD